MSADYSRQRLIGRSCGFSPSDEMAALQFAQLRWLRWLLLTSRSFRRLLHTRSAGSHRLRTAPGRFLSVAIPHINQRSWQTNTPESLPMFKATTIRLVLNYLYGH